MNWRKEFETIEVTSPDDVTIGDLIYWENTNNTTTSRRKKRFGVINQIIGNELWGWFKDSKEEALKATPNNNSYIRIPRDKRLKIFKIPS